MAQTGGNGLWRWLVGGLVGGGVLLGLLVAAYAIGYHRGERHAHGPEPASATTAPATTQPAETQPAATSPSTLSPAQALARGKKLYTADGCSGCHTLNGSASSGPTFKSLAGSKVALANGSTVTADDAYLAQSITDPDAQIVDGYQPGIMSAAAAGLDLKARPDDVQALVAFIDTRK